VLAPDKNLFSARVFASPTDFLEPISFHRCSDFSFLLSVQASRPSGLPLGSPSGCVGLGQGCLFFPSLQAGARRAGTASDLFTRCCCFHIPAAFSLILCLLVPSNLARMSAAHVGLNFPLLSSSAGCARASSSLTFLGPGCVHRECDFA
jgi:hypothetical protein